MESGEPVVTVILPTRNERDNIADCIKKARRALERIGLPGEIIVSDSSTDDTREIARSHGVVVLHPDRLGYGYAYIYALRYARGRYIVMADGDGTYDLEETPSLLDPLLRGEADVVLGTRFKGRIMPGAMSWVRKNIGNPLLTFILNTFYGTSVSDAHTGFRAFTREALEKIRPRATGMEFASELIVKAAYAGLRIKEVPITYYPRKGGKSKLRDLRDGWRHVCLMLTLAPKFLYYVPGLIMIFFGLVLMTIAFFRVQLGLSPGIHSSMLGSIFVILGLNLASLGLITDAYLASVMGKPTSSITTFFQRHLNPQRLMLLGAILTFMGLLYLFMVFITWVNSNFRFIPLRGENILASTLIIVGTQVFAQAFVFNLYNLTTNNNE